MTHNDEDQLELLPATIAERIQAAARAFIEREDRKAQKKIKKRGCNTWTAPRDQEKDPPAGQ